MHRSLFTLAGALAMIAGSVASAQTVITQWNFNSLVSDINTATGVSTPNIGAGTIALFGGNTVTFASGDASGGSTDPNVGDDSAYNTSTYAGQGAESGQRGVEFAVSTVNFTNVVLTWDQRHSNSASRWIRVSYSVDGVNYLTAAEIEATLGGDTWYNNRTVDFTGLTGVNDNPNFKVRIAPIFTPGMSVYETSTVGSSYGTGGTGGGTQRFDMVTFAGNPIVSTPPTGNPSVTPGAVCNTGGVVTLVVDTQAGASPDSTNIQVVANLAVLGGSISQPLSDDGITGGDAVAGDGNFTTTIAVPGGLTLGDKLVPITVSDDQSRSSSTSATVAVVDCSQNAASRVVISQVFGGGANQGPPAGAFDADYVELYNRSNQTVDLTGWSVQYAGPVAVGGFDSAADQVLLGGVIQPGQYMLVRMSDRGPIGSAIPTADFAVAQGLGGMGNNGGRVALVRAAALIGTNCSSADVEDLVGYGAAACFEGAAAAGTTANDTAAVRVNSGATDRNQNFVDFVVGAGTPRNRAFGGFLAGFASQDVATVCAGTAINYSVNVSPASSPASTGVVVTADLSAIGGGSAVALSDQGGNLYTLSYSVPTSVSQGGHVVTITTADQQGRVDRTRLSVAVADCSQSSAPVVISQINGGGGNATSVWNADFVEIFNRSNATVDLTGWSLQYANATSATGFNGGQQVNLSGSIEPGAYRLIQTNVASLTNGAPISTPDFVAAIAFGMDNQFGRVALVNSITPLGTTYPHASIMDFVGYGTTAVNFEGLAPAGTISNTTVALRKQGGCQDQNQNGIDFDIVAPLELPRNSASALNPCVIEVSGRCCIGSRCVIVTSAACVNDGPAGVIFTAGASNCNASGVLNTPCCFADYNKAGGVTVQDIFDFLAGWFAGSVNANVAGDGVATPTVQDIFDFLAVWFAGC